MTVAELLPNELEGQHAGETKVREVRVDVREDSSGRTALFVVLVLSEPPRGADTWPVDDLWALRRAVREAKSKIEEEGTQTPVAGELPWFVVFESKDHELLDAEDLDEQLDSDG